MTEAHDGVMSEPASPLSPPGPERKPQWAPVRASAGVLGGVCSGLAVAAGVEVTLVRLAFVATGLAGFGIIAYGVLWLVLPRQSAQHPLVPAPPETARWLGIGMLVAAIVGLLGVVGSVPWFGVWGPNDVGGNLWLGLVLMAVGALVLWSNRRHQGSQPAAAGPASSAPAPVFTPSRAPAEPVVLSAVRSRQGEEGSTQCPPVLPQAAAACRCSPPRGRPARPGRETA